uniref:Uncharacterized protein n=1 Tax=Rhizophora mucronata TaxID=61149 RepID=A0A2P2NH11_RHIMU
MIRILAVVSFLLSFILACFPSYISLTHSY